MARTWGRIAGSLLAVASLALLSGAAAAQAKVKLGYMPIAEEMPKFVAAEKGIFGKHGLDVQLVRFESGPDMGTALLGGSIQIGMIGTPGLINAAVAGRPIIAVVDNGSNTMGSAGHEYYTGLVVLDESPIKTIGDLKGRKVALNVLKANSEAQTVLQVRRWNQEHPGQQVDLNKDVQFVVIPFGSMPTALEKGIVDAASMIEPYMTQLTKARKVRIIAPVQYAMAAWPVSFGVVRRDFGEQNADTVQRFRAAWKESVQWIRGNPDEARGIMQKYAGVPPDVARQITLPQWSDDIRTTLRSTEQVMDGMLAAGMIPKRANLSEIIIDDLATLKK
jgi:NitT/TauT family transport system substrate-binding protein